MNVTTKNLFESLQKVRAKNPLVHNITNLVVMDFSANALLSLGASPVMAHATQEVESFAKMAGALVINIGTLSSAWIESMQIALKSANQNNVPTVLDPVGAGATTFRTETVNALLSKGKFSVIRGNASEIMSLTSHLNNTKGVDSTAKSSDAVENAKILSNKTGSVVVVSGEKDFIVNGNQVTSLEGGHIMMTKVTGMGCVSTSFVGAFLGAGLSPVDAAIGAMAVMKVAGGKAAEKAQGPASLRTLFLDTVYTLQENDYTHFLRINHES